MHPIRLATLAAIAAIATLLAGCGMHHPYRTGGSLRTGPAGEVTALAQLRTPDGRPGGTVRMTETSQGVLVVAEVEGFTSPGPRGFHIHTAGNCAPSTDAGGRSVAFGAAEGHFDPGQSGRHGAPAQAPAQSHAGDMPNLPVQADGRGSLSILNPNITLGPGPRSVMGRSVVVHEKADDLRSQPAGDSGGRVLCGVIVPVRGGPRA